nr:transcriptional regulator [Sphingomonas xinjiangensis]
MRVFLDFEASSLSKHSYPIEVGWVFEDGTSEAHLIRPAPEWTEWDPEAEAIHHITRAQLERDGTPYDAVAARMVAVLSGHDLFASAPSWDGKWLSTLLRAAGLPRHGLRLRDSDDLLLETAREGLRERMAADRLEEEAANLVALCEVRRSGAPPAHRALADAQEEHAHWLAVRTAALPQ